MIIKILKNLILIILSLVYNICQIVCSSPKRKIAEPINYLLLTPISGNLGDHAIAIGVMKILNANTVELVGDSKMAIWLLKLIIRKQDVIIITGGGFLGSLYKVNEEFVLKAIKKFANNKIVIMPQTIYYETLKCMSVIPDKTIRTYKSHSNLIVMCRESRSLATAKNLIGVLNAYLFPDTVLVTARVTAKSEKCNTVIAIIRNDKEALYTTTLLAKLETYCKKKNYEIKTLDTNKHKIIMPNKRTEEIDLLFEDLLNARFVVTDRLHGMIFSYITQTPCVALNNISGKVEAVYNDWLANSGYIILADEINIEESLLKIDNIVSIKRYDNFAKYANQIRSILKDD